MNKIPYLLCLLLLGAVPLSKSQNTDDLKQQQQTDQERLQQYQQQQMQQLQDEQKRQMDELQRQNSPSQDGPSQGEGPKPPGGNSGNKPMGPPPCPPPPPRGDPLMEYLFPPNVIMDHQREIKLTETQKKKIKSEMDNMGKQGRNAEWDLRNEMEKLEGLLKPDHVDEEAALSQVDRVMDLENKLKRIHLSMLIRIKNILTSDQQAKLREIMDRYSHGRSLESLLKEADRALGEASKLGSDKDKPVSPLIRDADQDVDQALKDLNPGKDHPGNPGNHRSNRSGGGDGTNPGGQGNSNGFNNPGSGHQND